MDKGSLYRQVAQLHVDNLDQGFLATLGTKFLALLYRAIDEVPESVLLVEERDGRVVGFVAGGVGMRSIYRRMLRWPLQLTVALLPAIARPASFRRVMEILHYGGSEGQQAALPEAELFSIAVAPAYRGKRVADALYLRLLKHFETTKVSAFKVTVGDILEPAHRFYRRMGAVPAAKMHVHDGEPSTVYVHRIC